MTSIGSRPEAVWRAWRPMPFGPRPARSIRDPIIEPLWPGRRVLVHVESVSAANRSASPRQITIRDESGLELAGQPEFAPAVFEAAGAGAFVLDGYLLDLPRRDAPGAFVGPSSLLVPGLGDTTRQLMLGARGRGPDGPGGDRPRISPGAGGSGGAVLAEPAAAAAVAALVAIDILAIDADELLDVPLLERKRLLDSMLAVNERVRRGPHVRPPVDSWYGQWRAFGFRGMAVKAANSRYQPGQPSADWAIASIPRG